LKQYRIVTDEHTDRQRPSRG